MAKIGEIRMTGGENGVVPIPDTNGGSMGSSGPVNGTALSGGDVGMRTTFSSPFATPSGAETPGETIRTTVGRVNVPDAPGESPSFMDIQGSGTVAGGFGGKGGIS